MRSTSAALLIALMTATGMAGAAPYSSGAILAGPEQPNPAPDRQSQAQTKSGSTGVTQEGKTAHSASSSSIPYQGDLPAGHPQVPPAATSGSSAASSASETGADEDVTGTAATDASSERRAVPMDCLPSSVDCPVVESSDPSNVITTDSLPIGSTGERDGPISGSGYPSSPGVGGMGSGATGSPTGPRPGPMTGIGR